jgi:arylsulfatase A-like enzyme
MERSLETHIPYGEPGHGEKLPEELTSKWENSADYFSSHTHEEIMELYEDAARKSAEHFLDHVEELKERGIYEDTLIIFTADHGDAMGDRVFGRRRYDHNYPGCHHIAEVPTLFFNHKVEPDRMRSVDIVETALQLTGNSWMLDTDGVNVTEELPSEGECPTGPGIVDLNWRWNSTKGRWEMTPVSKLKALFEDLFPERLMRKLGMGRRFNFGDEDG